MRSLLVLAVLCLNVWPLSIAQAQNQPLSRSTASYNYAVVYSVAGARHVFRGIVSSPRFTARVVSQRVPSVNIGRTAPSGTRYEICVLRGTTQFKVWYDPDSRRYIDACATGNPGWKRDDGSLAKIIASAKPTLLWKSPARTAHGTKHPVVTAQMPLEPGAFAVMCKSPDVIAIGQVVGIWRMDHTPVNSLNMSQHTVFLFAVEQYLKRRCVPAVPLLKIHWNGGDLPWVWHGTTGQGYSIEGDPRLQVGARYVLFLNTVAKPWGRRNTPYAMANIDGVQGKSGDWDELLFSSPYRAKLLLRDGVVQPIDPARNWRFDYGEQILGLPEQTVRERIAHWVRYWDISSDKRPSLQLEKND